MDQEWRRTIDRRAARIMNRLQTENTREAFQFWLDIVQSGAYPTRADVTPHSLRKVLPNLILIEVLRDPLDFRYRLVGTKVDYFVGTHFTDLRFSEIRHQAEDSNIFAVHAELVEKGIPMCGQIPYVGPFADIRDIQDIMLPLFDQDGNVTHILNALDFPLKSQVRKMSAEATDKQLRAE